VENSTGPSERDARRTFTVASQAFPTLSNPQGHVLDKLKKQGRR
jgi:hypothetical protein